jgi:dolichol kinase
MTVFRSIEDNYSTEFVRKGIHLASLLIPIIYAFIPRSTAVSILVPLTAVFVLSDIARLTIPAFGRFYLMLFGFLLRNHELNDKGRRLTGASYVMLAAVIMVAFFPKVLALTALAILIVSDTSAALIGRRWGKRPFLTKSVEGSSAFFISAVLVVAATPKIEYRFEEYLIGMIGALVGAVVEASGIGLDDNLSIPLSVGGVMWASYALLLPAVNILRLDQVF